MLYFYWLYTNIRPTRLSQSLTYLSLRAYIWVSLAIVARSNDCETFCYTIVDWTETFATPHKSFGNFTIHNLVASASFIDEYIPIGA